MTTSTLRIETECGMIDLRLRTDAAPLTVRYISETAKSGLYDGCCFYYKSDDSSVIQCGIEGSDDGRINPKHDLAMNETKHRAFVSNTRGTAAIAHDKPDSNGSTEFFINVKDNALLDEANGGYCVFAEAINPDSLAMIDVVAATMATGRKPKILKMSVVASGQV